MRRLLHRYCDLFGKFLLFELKAKMSYRWNFLLQTLYGPAYTAMLFLVLQTVYTKTNSLLGWSWAESLLLFAVFHSLYATALLAYINGIRFLLWRGVREGMVDFVLTKPINPQFLIAFSHPEIQQLPLVLTLFGTLFYAAWINQVDIINTGFFIVGWILGQVINYLAISTYATFGFYVTRAQQVLEIYDKFTDHAQYPTSIYPLPVQALAFSLIPTAFLGFIPTQIWLGKASPWWLVWAILLIIVLGITNKLAWQFALKKYTSASS